MRLIFVICIGDSSNALKGNSRGDKKAEETNKNINLYIFLRLKANLKQKGANSVQCAVCCAHNTLGMNLIWFLLR